MNLIRRTIAVVNQNYRYPLRGVFFFYPRPKLFYQSSDRTQHRQSSDRTQHRQPSKRRFKAHNCQTPNTSVHPAPKSTQM